MKTFIREDIEQYAFRSTRAEPELLQQLERLTYEHMEYPHMLTGRLEGRLLKLLVQIANPKLVIEIGTFTGYSALSMAEGLADDAKLITCEINPKAQRAAQAAFDASPHGYKIDLRIGPALETIRGLHETIDFAFVDADKEAYPAYYEEVLTRMRPGGIIVLDNMFLSGYALKPENKAAHAIAQLNETIANDARVENVLLTVRDGVQLVRKK